MVSVLFAYFHLVLKANSVLCGTAINTIAAGLTVFVLQLLTGEKGSSSSLNSFQFPTLNIPIIENIPVLGRILSGHNILTYMGLLMVFLIHLFFYRTPIGLRIRAVGETPKAAESVGINVVRIRLLAILLCGIMAGFGDVSFHGVLAYVYQRYGCGPWLYCSCGKCYGAVYADRSVGFIFIIFLL